MNKKTGKITVKHVYAAQDAGLTVNPNLVENQMLGSVVLPRPARRRTLSKAGLLAIHFAFG